MLNIHILVYKREQTLYGFIHNTVYVYSKRFKKMFPKFLAMCIKSHCLPIVLTILEGTNSHADEKELYLHFCKENFTS